MVRTSKPEREVEKSMKIWLTIEPNKEEVQALVIDKMEGVSKTPLKAVIDHAYILMDMGHEVSLKVTTMKRRDY